MRSVSNRYFESIPGPDNAVQKQAQGLEKASEALRVSVNSLEISASPLTENCNKLKEFSPKSTLNFDEPSTEVKRILKVLAVISPKALSASVNEMREAVCLNDVMPPTQVLIFQLWRLILIILKSYLNKTKKKDILPRFKRNRGIKSSSEKKNKKMKNILHRFPLN
ncbi:hypothetical protein LR48_Vigan10g138700 [Vigna angularis]|uniref:Uncharacterized protein n=1 Tax=Phaseolus angularis TaxID=3914 RepID=A0A0L9VKD0_PHAAN|nr:hypothetical protein LR48_Vigan10g138700 [Vigna angularis]